MAIPTPDELLEHYPATSVEALARALHIAVRRAATPPALPGVTVFSAYEAEEEAIVLYPESLRELARRRGEPPARLEAWHIAHELYHALAEADHRSPWRVRETAADLWADELLALLPG